MGAERPQLENYPNTGTCISSSTSHGKNVLLPRTLSTNDTKNHHRRVLCCPVADRGEAHTNRGSHDHYSARLTEANEDVKSAAVATTIITLYTTVDNEDSIVVLKCTAGEEGRGQPSQQLKQHNNTQQVGTLPLPSTPP